MSIPLTRTIVLWCPDWPISAARRSEDIPADVPLALIDKGLVFACSAEARRDGVKRGLKLREAQHRCTGLMTLPYNPVHDSRAFEPVITRIEEMVPGVQLIRPGTSAVRARGPERYYGGEEQAASALLRGLSELGIDDARVGIADGPFAAEQVARSTSGLPGDAIRIVPLGETPGFLAPLPIDILVDDRLGTLLHRLGVHTLGSFAALPALDVVRRFGAAGAQAHEKASGYERASVVARVPPKLFDQVVEFEPALDRTDQVTFAIRASAEDFIQAFTQANLVCTALCIEVKTESGEISERSWLHPRWFSAGDVVDRVRWQLQGSQAIDSGLRSGIVMVRLSPDRVDGASNHEQGLWGQGPDERIHHGLTRVQGMLGHEGVLTAVIGGGRLLADRQVLVPWGDKPAGDGAVLERAKTQPWPGSLRGTAPATVFQSRRPVGVVSTTGEAIDVDERGALTGEPEWFSPTGLAGDFRQVDAWAGPWPVTERWWDPARATALHRFQLVDVEGNAWLLSLDDHRWWAEARYD